MSRLKQFLNEFGFENASFRGIYNHISGVIIDVISPLDKKRIDEYIKSLDKQVHTEQQYSIRNIVESLGEKEAQHTILLEEFYKNTSDILTDSEFHKNMQGNKHNNKNLLTHSLNVSYTAFKKSAEIGSLNERAVARGGLLHDFYGYDGFNMPKELAGLNHGLIHPYIAFMNSNRQGYLKENDNQKLMEDIIVNHMWPFTNQPWKNYPRTTEAVLVSLSDKYHATKEYIKK